MNAPLRTDMFEPPILVWTVGKVASSSIHATLLSQGLEALHVHYLSDWHLSHQVNGMYAGKRLPLHIVSSLRFRHGFDRNIYRTPIRAITLVRDPLARNISAYFENLQHFSKAVGRDADVSAHVQNFLDRYPHEVALDWLDDELNAVAGIDYRGMNFKPEEGWCISRSEKFEVLVMRAENSDKSKLEALSEFLGTRLKSIARENEAAGKSYSELYRGFRERIELPPQYVEFMYDNDVCRTFWTAHEIHLMKEAWRRSDQAMKPVRRGARGAGAEYQGPVADPQSARAVSIDVGVVTKVSATCSIARAGFDQQVHLQVSFDVSQPLPEPLVELRIIAENDVVLCALHPGRGVQRQPIDSGPCSIAATIADLPLAAGEYGVVLKVADVRAGVLYEACVATLFVGPNQARAGSGLLAPSYRWRQTQGPAAGRSGTPRSDGPPTI